MAGGQDVVTVAQSQIGLSGAERYDGKVGDAWCALFVRWCAKTAGVPARIVPKKPWCDDLVKFYRERALWHESAGYTPKVGDIICFNWNGTAEYISQVKSVHINHVGLVSGVRDGYVHTVEGNSGVDRCVHAWKYPLSSACIVGYCSPAYEEKSKKSGKASKQDPEVTKSMVTVVEEAPTVVRIEQGRLVAVPPKPNALTIAITADGHTFAPRVLAGAKLEWTRTGAPGTFTFEVLPGGESFYEGSRVHAMVGSTVVFYGYVFTKTRDMDGIIRVTAYDQLRYFKNKDLYLYENKSVDELLSMLCRDYGLLAGTVETSEVKLPYRMEDNNTLFDMMEYAIDYTETKSGERFVLYDDAGRLMLRHAWESGVILRAENVREFSYTSSVDGMYNRVKAISEADGVRSITLLQDTDAIGRYGVLQTLLRQDERDLDAARGLLALKNKISRRLRLCADGDIRVRAGCKIELDLVLGDLTYRGLIGVHSVCHVWDGHDHTMELVLEGGEFDA